eukprot:705050-Amphidinium_carterae.1
MTHIEVALWRSRNVSIKGNHVHQAHQHNEVQVCFKRTAEMIADALTKALPKGKHWFFVNAMGLVATATK